MSLMEAEQRALQDDNDELRKDLADIIHNQTLSNQLQHEKALNHVSFHVQLSRDVTVFSSRPLVFDRIVNNKGSAYSTYTGRFTAPLSGTYFFAATCAPTNSTLTCYIQAAVTRVCVMRAHYGRLSSDSIYHQWGATCHASLHLTRGAEVWVGVETTASFNGSYTSFSGFSVDLD
ncbi:caprin-2-like [Pomacea canaliculata]|nr:caprin-2-like [Pomacea canaliculata]